MFITSIVLESVSLIGFVLITMLLIGSLITLLVLHENVKANCTDLQRKNKKLIDQNLEMSDKIEDVSSQSRKAQEDYNQLLDTSCKSNQNLINTIKELKGNSVKPVDTKSADIPVVDKAVEKELPKPTILVKEEPKTAIKETPSVEKKVVVVEKSLFEFLKIAKLIGKFKKNLFSKKTKGLFHDNKVKDFEKSVALLFKEHSDQAIIKGFDIALSPEKEEFWNKQNVEYQAYLKK